MYKGKRTAPPTAPTEAADAAVTSNALCSDLRTCWPMRMAITLLNDASAAASTQRICREMIHCIYVATVERQPPGCSGSTAVSSDGGGEGFRVG